MKNNNNPLVSIIIPCYNVTGYLEPCLNSCILQTYKNIEILTINDGSKDDTKEIIEYYAQKDKRIKPVNKENEGLAKARITGIEHSSGEYLFFLDGDDYLAVNSIEVLVNQITDTDIDTVLGNLFVEYENGFQTVKHVENSIYNKNDLIIRVLQGLLFSLCGKLFKRNLFNTSLCYHSDLTYAEDDIVLIQLIQNSDTIKYTDNIVYYYRLRGASITKSLSSIRYKDYYKAHFLLEKYAIEYGLKKDKNQELGICICNMLSFIVKNRSNRKLDTYWKKTVQEKTQSYLIHDKEFATYYRQTRNKNYFRIIFYYHFPFIKETLFEIIYKIFKKIL